MSFYVQKTNFCKCGCGQVLKEHLYGRSSKPLIFHYIQGHQNRGRIAWNKGKSFSISSKFKMHLARLGKEPANKSKIDIKSLYDLYINQNKNASEVSQILNVSKDSVKNRLRALGWSRTSKDSCTSAAFKDKMQKIRVRVLAERGRMQSPNKLEAIVYQTIESLGVSYQRQFPLFGKFVVDALIPQKKLVLEIFGRYWHELPNIKKKDISKKKYLEKCGYTVQEIWDYQLKEKGATAVLSEIFTKFNLI